MTPIEYVFFGDTMLNRFFLFFVSLLLVTACQKPENHSHSKSVKRVVSLSPHITEIIFALDAQDKLVGISDFCTYPPETDQIERIGGLLNPNLEKLLSLNADLFIGTSAHNDLAQKLYKQSLHTVLLPNDRFEDIFTAIDSIGILLQKSDKARQLQKTIRDSVAFYTKQSVQFDQKPKALLSIGREPGTTRKITASGNETFIAEMWQKAGAENVFSNLPAKYAQVSREALLKMDPDLIIEFKFKETWNAEKDQANKKEWTDLRNLQAVRRGQVYVLSGDYTLIPGPRIYLLARDYQNILQKYTAGL